MENSLNTNVIPVNKPASKGVVGAMKLAQSEPDGYTLYFNSQTLVLLSLSEEFIDLRKFQPVAQVVQDTSAITVPVDAPYDTLQGLIEYAKDNPGELKIATNGKDALWYFAAANFADGANLDLQFVPYTSGGAAMSKALASGEVDIAANSPTEVKPLVDAGKLKVLAVQSKERHSLYPDVPTAKEAGIDITFPVWRGVFTKAGIGEEKLNKLSNSVERAYNSERFQTFLENKGMPGKFRGHEKFEEFFEAQVNRYEELIN
ncbi:hypothetical protein BTW10_02615 [Chromohalobacter japonicus]|uniref:ABC transporter substrate-binding protein n=2 Tax=Chromohalobacter japonicus TaxID=223900 RepID=A0A1Q8TFD8_9GAMM|nr:hypothetical protein BTW10_02615 [Chromohalobacter japonicus]